MDSGMLNETVRREIRAEMARQNVSQLELALRLGSSRMYVSHRLRGAVGLSLKDVESIAKQLGVPIEQLLAPARV